MPKQGSVIRRLFEQRLGEAEMQLPDDKQAREQWPILWEWLTARSASDEYLKEPARVTISLGLGCWQVSVSDADLGVGMDTSAQTLSGTFEALEAKLRGPTPDFRSWRGKEVQLRRKKQPKKD